MNNKGFTLIELLGAVIIIAMLALLTFPAVLRQIRDSQKTLVEAELTTIKVATERFLNDNKNLYPRNPGTNYCIKIQDLVDEGYLKGSFVEANEGDLINDDQAATFQKDGYIKMNVTAESKYSYVTIASTCTP